MPASYAAALPTTARIWSCTATSTCSATRSQAVTVPFRCSDAVGIAALGPRSRSRPIVYEIESRATVADRRPRAGCSPEARRLRAGRAPRGGAAGRTALILRPGTRPDDMPKIGLISNPQSQRNRRGLDAIRRAVAGVPDVIQSPPTGARILDEALQEFARQDVGVLLINGGDGTVQTVLTRCSGRPTVRDGARFAILARGTANTTAANLGLRGRAAAGARAAARGGPRRHARAASRRAADPAAREHPGPRTAARDDVRRRSVPDAIELCCREIYARGLRARLASSVTLAGLLLGTVLRRELRRTSAA